jgi:hypothetical protein
MWLVVRLGAGHRGDRRGAGHGGAFALTQLLSHLLYSVSTLEPIAYIAAPLVLISVALLATCRRAFRASRWTPWRRSGHISDQRLR